MRYLCIIPAKAESMRIPGKNMVDLCGKPMIQYTLEAVKDCKLFDQIVVSTNATAITSLAAQLDLPVVIRPEELCQPETRVAEVCLYVIEEQLEEVFDRFCLLLPTNPLRTAADVMAGLAFFDLVPPPKFVMSVSEYSFNARYALTSASDPRQEAEEGSPGRLVPLTEISIDYPRRSFPPTHYADGSVYWADVIAFLACRSIAPTNPGTVFFRLPKERAIDVDESMDLILAEALLKKRQTEAT